MKKLGILAAAAILGATATSQAEIPAGYPQSCAVVDHCAPVSEVAWIVPVTGSAPKMMLISSFGKASVRRHFEIAESRDGRFHVCMRYDPFGDLEVTCLLVPARGF